MKKKKIFLSNIFVVDLAIEEVLQNIYCISSAIEYLLMEVLQNIPIYWHSVTLGYNGIFNIIYLKTPALECIFSGTWSCSIVSNTSIKKIMFVFPG